jgi:hypothetical protein
MLDDDMSICCKKCGAVFDLEELPDLYEEFVDDDGSIERLADDDGDPRGDLDDDERSERIEARRRPMRGE